MNKRLTSEEISDLRKKHFLPTSFHYYSEPLQIAKASGCLVWDEKGTEYLDAFGGIVCISAGHNHAKIKEGIKQMLDADEIQHTSLIYFSRWPALLAQKIIEQAPQGIDRAFFTNSGSEANELAFLSARHSTGESMIINLRHSYHGSTGATLATCGHHMWKYRAQPVGSVTSAVEPYCYRCPFDKKPTSCSLECAKNVETTIQTTTNGRIAGMVIEPVMGVGGYITPPVEYFHEVAKIVHNYGGKYISDEVQTGAGRGGHSFLMSNELKIDADIVTMAKGFGNGAAIGATLMKSEIANSMVGKKYFNTFGGDPYQTMQAHLTMEIIEEEKLIENSAKMGKILKEGLEQLMKRHKIIGDVRGRGLLVGFELVKDRVTKAYASDETLRLMDLCKKRRVLIGRGGLHGNVIRLAPPMSITNTQINRLLEVIDESLVELSH
jgi:alanine-glyoxylate transaminase/(R)-3-amino-2-methylpropionate-pyruvate transaminase